MKFKEDLQRLSTQVTERKQHIHNEEMTKQALIIPFLQVLGYDVFNPLEVKPEYVADVGRKKGEKVDYAIYKNDNPIMFIEAKSVNDPLTNHSAQLARYFNATPDVRFAIMTNGIEYRFYTDLDKNNIMDENSFIKIDVTNLSEADIEVLSRFKKDVFITEDLINYASELVYTSNINNKLKDLFRNPPDEFIRYLIKDFSDVRVTTNVLERFRPIVKKSISLALLDIVSQGLFKEEVATIEELVDDKDESSEKEKQEITTSEDELQCFEIVNDILKSANKDISDIKYRDTTVYFGIYNRIITNWFLRINMESLKKNIITKLPIEKAEKLAVDYNVESAPKGLGESRIYIESIDDIEKLSQLIIECYNNTVA